MNFSRKTIQALVIAVIAALIFGVKMDSFDSLLDPGRVFGAPAKPLEAVMFAAFWGAIVGLAINAFKGKL